MINFLKILYKNQTTQIIIWFLLVFLLPINHSIAKSTHCSKISSHLAKGKCIAIRPLRISVGSISCKGWEKKLIQKDSNLARYYWEPIHCNITQIKTVKVYGNNSKYYFHKGNCQANKSKIAQKSSKVNYSNSSLIAFKSSKADNYNSTALKYSKPIQIPPQYPSLRYPNYKNNLDLKLINKDLSPQLSMPNTNVNLIAQAKPLSLNLPGKDTSLIYTYTEPYKSSVNAKLLTKNTHLKTNFNKEKVNFNVSVYGQIAKP